ncbi:hypothetical protein GCM10022209_01830 [Chitinophaga oryziterrae]
MHEVNQYQLPSLMVHQANVNRHLPDVPFSMETLGGKSDNRVEKMSKQYFSLEQFNNEVL